MASAAGASLCLFIYRALSIPTFRAVLELLAAPLGAGVYIGVETGDALISRARSTAASVWLRQRPTSDVLVMCDDDFYFTPEGFAALVALARQTRGIVAGVTPLRSGEHTAIVPLDGRADEPWRDPACPPMPIKWAGGLLAFHRSVFEALTHTLPLLHKDDRIAPFWPFFLPAMTTAHGADVYLSEDYACLERARALGFSVTVQPACQVWHAAELMVTTGNMDAVRELYNDPRCGMVSERTVLTS